MPSPSQIRSGAQTTIDTGSDTLDLESKAVSEGLMKEGDNYFQVFPAHLLQLAQEQLATTGNTAANRRKCWEKVQVMAKLMQQQVWKSTTQHLSRELALEVATKVGEQMGPISEELRETKAVLAKVAERVETTLGKSVEEGEITDSALGHLSYAQALQTQTIAQATDHLQRSRHTFAIQAGKIMDRRSFVKSGSESDWTLKESELAQKANLAISKLLEVEGEDKEYVKVVAVQRVTKARGFFCILRKPEELQWLMEDDRLTQFRDGWGPDATAELSRFEVVAEYVSLTATLDSPWTLEKITKESDLPPNSITMARWIRKPEKRSPKQVSGYAIFSFNTRKAANEAIRKGMVIESRLVNIRKEVKDPQRCMKCQQAGHIARECNSDVDVCGRCGKDHPTQTCTTEREHFYCTPCKSKGHIAADRSCPTFLRRLRERDERDPTRGYRYFVTEEPWTWASLGEHKDPTPSWRMDLQREFNQNWKVVQRGKGKGRLAGGNPGDGNGQSPRESDRG